MECKDAIVFLHQRDALAQVASLSLQLFGDSAQGNFDLPAMMAPISVLKSFRHG